MERLCLVVLIYLRSRCNEKKMIDTIIGMGMFGTLLYIASKMAVVNDMTHEIRDLLINRSSA